VLLPPRRDEAPRHPRRRLRAPLLPQAHVQGRPIRLEPRQAARGVPAGPLDHRQRDVQGDPERQGRAGLFGRGRALQRGGGDMRADLGEEVARAVAGRWRRLEDRAVFRLVGPDRIRYLNGQVSNDVSKLDGGSIAACLCAIKGKVEALVWIHADGEALVLDGELRQREFLRTRLERYLIADDCELEDATG